MYKTEHTILSHSLRILVPRTGLTGWERVLDRVTSPRLLHGAIIFIKANNPAIGLMAVLAVSMAEVSTCDIGVEKGQRIEKGEQIGMFHFGGSTHYLLFRENVNVHEFLEPGRTHNVPVCSELAIVRPSLS